MRILALTLFAAVLCYSAPSRTQEPPPTAPANPGSTGSSSQAPPPASAKDSASTKKKRPLPSFLILGTVYNENALSFPGVQVRIRRKGEKKFRWEAYTNSRGEFAVRVPPGYDYEVVTHVKKYEDQTQSVDSKVDVQQRLSIKLQPQEKTKSGEKP